MGRHAALTWPVLVACSIGVAWSSPPLSIVSLTALNTAVLDSYAAGDSIEISFSAATNKANGSDALTSRSQVDAIVTFSQSLGASYTGFWTSPSVLLVTIVNASTATPPQIGVCTATINGNPFGGSVSPSLSPVLNGSFSTAPTISSVVCVAAPGQTTYAPGSQIVITFDRDTDRAGAGSMMMNTTTTNALVRASQALGQAYNSTWTTDSILTITIANVSGSAPPSPGTLKFNVVGPIRNAARTSSTGSGSVSSVATGSFRANLMPIINSISPASGPLTGTTTITITGSWLGNSASDLVNVTMAGGVCGMMSCANVVWVSSRRVTCRPPATSAPGTVTVHVQTLLGGTSATNGTFRYSAPPAVTSVSPISIPRAGGATVTIIGSNLAQNQADIVSVTIGGASCASVSFVNSSVVTCTSPAVSAPGIGTVAVSSTANGASSSSVAFVFQCSPGQFQRSLSCVNCTAGYYSLGYGTSSNCSATPPGYMAPSIASPAVPCPAGTFSLGLATACTPCALGRYQPTNGSTSCITCPAGSYCNATVAVLCPTGRYSIGGVYAQTCTACAPGYYASVPGSTNCTAAPAGFATLSAALSPIQCPAGTYSLGLATVCTVCPPGYRCPSTSTLPVPCTPGQYSAAMSTTCTNCPAGMFCPTTNSSSVCPPGTYSLGSATSCTPCPAGFQCTEPDLAPVQCSAGRFSVGNQVACTDCSIGSACPSLTSAASIKACQPGTFSVGDAANCTTCPAGYYCPFTDANIQIPCPLGKYSFGGQANCTDCAPGRQCPTTASNGSPCPTGRWSTGGSSACTSCSPGTACPDPTSSSYKVCSPGSYSIQDSTSCTTCPAGFACPYTTSATVIPCAPNTFSFGNQTNCTRCAPGYTCSTRTSSLAVPCSPGTYAAPGHALDTCTVAPPGTYSNSTTLLPVACLPGYYSLGAAVQCTICPAGSSCASASSPPQPCAAGAWSSAGMLQCSSCSAGWFCASTGSTTPQAALCPKGYWCTPGITALGPGNACPAGTYGNITGGRSQAESCQPCPAGYYCPSSNVPTIVPTLLCANGYVCPAGSATSNPLPCPAGRYVPNTTPIKGSLNDCILCPAGSYCLQAFDGSYNNTCPPGSYCPAGTRISNEYLCPAGRYSAQYGNRNATDCTACPAGSYCIEGSTSFTFCPTGTYNPRPGGVSLASCIPCPAGYACSTTGLNGTSSLTPCAQGHFCPNSTITYNQYPCPPGTYTDSTSATKVSDCLPCPSGWACPIGTGGTYQPPLPCALGHYCPSGTAYPLENPCPRGSYGPMTNLTSVSQCRACPAGSWCAGGMGQVSGTCLPGYVCPMGSTSYPDQFPCPAGTYNPFTNASTVPADCRQCSLGHMCPTPATVQPVPCPAGTFANTTSMVSCWSCPEGQQCSSPGTVSPAPCPAGKFSASGQATCSPCPAGYWCTQGTGSSTMYAAQACSPGVWCPGGVASNLTISTNPCPAGSYCPRGTSAPVACPAGRYRTLSGGKQLSDCSTCQPGSYCLLGSVNVTGSCSTGYYCPAGSTGSRAAGCPSGSFRNITGAGALSDCFTCPLRYYCPVASTMPVACPRGYTCPSGSSFPTPCPPGSYGNTPGLMQCIACDQGFYCDGVAMVVPRGPCSEGYLCPSGSASATAVLCPVGNYCPLGSWTGTPCPVGTYSNSTGLSRVSQCLPCPPSMYCSTQGAVQPTGLCQAGFYCPGSAWSPRQQSALPGYFATSGASSPTPCAPGTYQGSANATSCMTCPASFYCPGFGTAVPLNCTAGSWCPAGDSSPQPCPTGRYSSSTTLQRSQDCNPCPPGQYCITNGITRPTGNCTAGYVCYGNATVAQPTVEAFGQQCPPGFYCPSGIAKPIPCPVGTFRSNLLGTSVHDCQSCPAMMFCNSTGLSSPSGPILGGYWSLAGAMSPNPSPTGPGFGTCPVGHSCPFGSNANPSPCIAGRYARDVGQAQCDDCPSGYFCQAVASNATVCPAGAYCPLQTAASPPLCPAGTYSNRTGLSSVSQCTPCPPGWFCPSSGTTGPGGRCRQGYYCVQGSVNQFGGTSAYNESVCPAGSYCPANSSVPTPCPTGTYSPAYGNVALQNCLNCTAGSYCGTVGLAVVSGPCQAGYFCPAGSVVPSPNAGKCPVASFCPPGSAIPRPCPQGAYQPNQGSSSCLNCPAGFFCPGNTTSPSPCPLGFYCPNGTATGAQFPCPVSTYGGSTMLASANACSVCPPGLYCNRTGLTQPTGPCSGGYYCTGGASISTPTDGVTGNHCGTGNYCPVQSTGPTVCPGGRYCSLPTLAAPDGLVLAGYYSPSGATTPTPASGVCWAGHYCPGNGTVAPIPCSSGRWSPALGNTNSSACLPCLGGYYCPNQASSSMADLAPCVANYYCPPGTIYPSAICPSGASCPTGSSSPVLCQPGYYQDQQGQSACKPCPKRMYCSGLGTVQPKPCLSGSYCPAMTATPAPCPAGTFSNATSLGNVTECLPCTAGMYCDRPGLQVPSGPCAPGFYCISGQTTAQPANGICPPGMYCPMGSSWPNACAAGTLAPGSGNANASSCLPCPRGSFCSQTGAITLQGNAQCDGGYVCAGGCKVSSPGSGCGYQCPAGTYCIPGAFAPQSCQPGTFNPDPGRNSCLVSTAGFYSPNSGRATVISCPAGMYCPPGTINPQPCSTGRYSNRTNLVAATDCQLCDPGQYCNGTGLVSPSGPCAPGHFCASGSSSPSTTLCPRGAYCPQGATAPVACPVGMFNPNFGASDITSCLACTPSSFCSSVGATAVSGSCQPGYFCPAGSSSPQQVVCPKGHSCARSGNANAVPCAGGTYQPDPGSTSCIPCPAGSTCSQGAIVPVPAPIGTYAQAGAVIPSSCPAGRYGARPNLTDASECDICPALSFCIGGLIGGSVAPGYYCVGGCSTPTPLVLSTDGGAPCMPGYYCLGGVTPAACPANTYRSTAGASLLSDCLPCPAGSTCRSGDPTLYPCPAGHYCPMQSGPLPCPAGTYNALPGATSSAACLPCACGSLCGANATVDPTQRPCALGYVCPAGTPAPVPCPGGTYRSLPSGCDMTRDCTSCQPGTYCPPGSPSQIACPGGSYCPASSAWPIPCSGGTFCLPNSPQPIDCPAGSYCPANATLPVRCSTGYCPVKTTLPMPCPLGTFTADVYNRTNVTTSCPPCPAGRYQDQPTSMSCSTCTAGYLCISGAASSTPASVSSAGGRPCAPGHYCPAGTTSEIPCPTGTFRSDPGGASIDDCWPCAPGSFAATTGSSGCLPCPASATSTTGATACTCIGAYRTFQASDSSCICSSGYSSTDGFDDIGEQDSPKNCYPVVYDRCQQGSSLSSSGSCASTRTLDCTATCGPAGGTYVSAIGICSCNAKELSTICNATCQAQQATLCGRGNQVTIHNADGSTSTVALSTSIKCPAGQCCHMAPVNVGNGLSGAITMSSSATSTTVVRRRLLQSSGGSTNQQILINPAAVCLNLHDGIMFQINGTSYPVYQKDNLLNTNPDFDYGAFRALANSALSASQGAFAFTFDVAGVYVFASSTRPDQVMIVRVVPENTLCPLGGRIAPLTTSNLVALGIQRNPNVLLTPDWTLIGVLVGVGIVLFVSVLAGASHVSGSKWGGLRERAATYKATAAGNDVDVFNIGSKGSIVTKDTAAGALAEAGPVGPDDHVLAEVDPIDTVEQFDFQAIQRELQTHGEHVDKAMLTQTVDMHAFADRVLRDTDQLKSLLAIKLHDEEKCVSADDFSLVVGKLVKGELSARRLYEKQQGLREDDIQRTIADVQNEIACLKEVTFTTLRPLLRALCDALLSWTADFEAETGRREGLTAHLPLIGYDILDRLNGLDVDARQVHLALASAIADLHRRVVGLVSAVRDLQDQFSRRKAVLEEVHNQKGLASATSKYERDLLGLVKDMSALLAASSSSMGTLLPKVAEGRVSRDRAYQVMIEVGIEERVQALLAERQVQDEAKRQKEDEKKQDVAEGSGMSRPQVDQLLATIASKPAAAAPPPPPQASVPTVSPGSVLSQHPSIAVIVKWLESCFANAPAHVRQAVHDECQVRVVHLAWLGRDLSARVPPWSEAMHAVFLARRQCRHEYSLVQGAMRSTLSEQQRQRQAQNTLFQEQWGRMQQERNVALSDSMALTDAEGRHRERAAIDVFDEFVHRFLSASATDDQTDADVVKLSDDMVALLHRCLAAQDQALAHVKDANMATRVHDITARAIDDASARLRLAAQEVCARHQQRRQELARRVDAFASAKSRRDAALADDNSDVPLKAVMIAFDEAVLRECLPKEGRWSPLRQRFLDAARLTMDLYEDAVDNGVRAVELQAELGLVPTPATTRQGVAQLMAHRHDRESLHAFGCQVLDRGHFMIGHAVADTDAIVLRALARRHLDGAQRVHSTCLAAMQDDDVVQAVLMTNGVDLLPLAQLEAMFMAMAEKRDVSKVELKRAELEERDGDAGGHDADLALFEAALALERRRHCAALLQSRRRMLLESCTVATDDDVMADGASPVKADVGAKQDEAPGEDVAVPVTSTNADEMLIRRILDLHDRFVKEQRPGGVAEGDAGECWWADTLVQDLAPVGKGPAGHGSASTSAVLAWGNALVRRLVTRLAPGTAPIKVALSSGVAALAATVYPHCAMGHSFAYDAAGRCIAVSEDLAGGDRGGVFVVVVLHAASHVISGEWDRRKVAFTSTLAAATSIMAEQAVLSSVTAVQKDYDAAARLDRYQLSAATSSFAQYLSAVDAFDAASTIQAQADGDDRIQNRDDLVDDLNEELVGIVQRLQQAVQANDVDTAERLRRRKDEILDELRSLDQSMQ